MARNTKPLSGGAKDKFLRGLVEAVPGVPTEAAQAVTAALISAVSEVRARRDIYERIRDSAAVAPATAKSRVPRAPEATVTAAFDPFAFSVVAVLTKKGEAALATELDKVTSGDDLRRLAEAQHLALDPSITDIGGLRAAIVAGAERRIAERKAAAS